MENRARRTRPSRRSTWSSAAARSIPNYTGATSRPGARLRAPRACAASSRAGRPRCWDTRFVRRCSQIPTIAPLTSAFWRLGARSIQIRRLRVLQEDVQRRRGRAKRAPLPHLAVPERVGERRVFRRHCAVSHGGDQGAHADHHAALCVGRVGWLEEDYRGRGDIWVRLGLARTIAEADGNVDSTRALRRSGAGRFRTR
jgi:hypothetical protein